MRALITPRLQKIQRLNIVPHVKVSFKRRAQKHFFYLTTPVKFKRMDSFFELLLGNT